VIVRSQDGVAGARGRHPCMRTPIGPVEVCRRVADALEVRGARHPAVAASVLAVRGATGLGPEAFARRAGVDVGVLRRAEAGEIGRDQLPGSLRRMVPRP
jgi:hypothetical protein